LRRRHARYLFRASREPQKKPASAGWYNTAAFERLAAEHGRYAKDINGDAFSDAVKERTIELIKQDLGHVDLVIYSLAAPRRTDPRTGVVYTSTLKPIGRSVVFRTIDTDKEVVKEAALPAATDSEIEHTAQL
jgi:enoyl-[acyl-carrier protein] reductase/trans-2-enoyl-CoA reductase (NAD+)